MTIAAATSSPSFSCGTAKVSASCTAGCSRSTVSTSIGEIFSPPRLIISFSRPLMRRYPSSSSTPWSPVRNQPSANAAVLASGLFTYPSNRFGPRTTISPDSPVGRSFPPSPRIPICGPAARPTEPGLRASGGSGFDAIWCAASVIPYDSMPTTSGSAAAGGASGSPDGAGHARELRGAWRARRSTRSAALRRASERSAAR